MNALEQNDLMRESLKAMGRDILYSREWFIASSMSWLAKELGDLHVEYHADSGWQIACCYEEKTWRGWKQNKSLVSALAQAVLKVKEQEDLPSGTERPRTTPSGS